MYVDIGFSLKFKVVRSHLCYSTKLVEEKISGLADRYILWISISRSSRYDFCHLLNYYPTKIGGLAELPDEQKNKFAILLFAK